MCPPPPAASLARTAARASPLSQVAFTGVLAGAAVPAGIVVVVVGLDEGSDARTVGSAGPVPHAIRTPASVVAISSDTRSPRRVPHPPPLPRPRGDRRTAP